jgi:hypothetical protein
MARRNVWESTSLAEGLGDGRTPEDLLIGERIVNV